MLAAVARGWLGALFSLSRGQQRHGLPFGQLTRMRGSADVWRMLISVRGELDRARSAGTGDLPTM